MNHLAPVSLDTVFQLPTEVIPISSLFDADSPRLCGQDREHIKTLAETDRQLPAILVHRPTMRIIDGMHRVEAARLQGERNIAARFVDGDEKAAFVLAVQSNIAHGLPLTLADRRAAAVRILRIYPDWSNRAVARAAGLAAATVGAIRRATGSSDQSNTRLGSDGRVRPLNAAEGRKLASELIAKRPNASLRKIATEVGISPGTVRDVRKRLARGDDPVPPKQREAAAALKKVRSRCPNKPSAVRKGGTKPPAAIVRRLSKDPSIRSSEAGRELLRWLSAQSAGAGKWPEFLDCFPPHSTVVIMEMARAIAKVWDSFADELAQRTEALTE